MKLHAAIFTIVLGFAPAAPLHAHRVEGLLQASLVEVLPAQVGIEVTLVPGMDIAPKISALLDTNGDGVFSDAESAAWSARFMAGQSVSVDGKPVPLTVKNIRTTPLAEMTNGHAEIVVYFATGPGAFDCGAHTIVCSNRYEPIPCTYQTNGLVPKAPGVSISSHRRDERQTELTLAAEYSGPATSATLPATGASRDRSAAAIIPGLIGLSVAGVIVAVLVKRRHRTLRRNLCSESNCAGLSASP